MTPSDVVMAQLLAARASIDAAIALMDMSEPPKADIGPCQHPDEKRSPMPVSGDLGQFMCRACHTIVSKTAEVPDGP